MKNLKGLNILIFGTGLCGRYFYKNFCHPYQILGFIDNNKDKQGAFLFGKRIIKPSDITQINFNKVIIASDYQHEILQQLNHKLDIAPEKIFFFHQFKKKKVKLHFFYSTYIDIFLLNTPYPWAHFLCKNRIFFKDKKIVKIGWLDKNSVYKTHVLCEEKISSTYVPKMIDTQQKKESLRLPEIAVYQFPRAYIAPISRTVLLNNNTIVIEHVQSVRPDQVNYAGHFIYKHNNKNALIWTQKQKPIEISKGIAITGGSDTNYYHIVIEVLSQLHYLNQLPGLLKTYPLLLSEKLQEIESVREFLSYLEPNQNIIWLKKNSTYCVEKLVWISTPNQLAVNLKKSVASQAYFCYIRPESIDWLRNKVLTKITSKPLQHNRRIFLARNPSLRSYNQDEIWSVLQKYDFEWVQLEKMSLLEQAICINSASVIIGPTGAAWTNLMFARPKTQALCWMAYEYGELSCFSNLAQTVDVQLDYIRYSTGIQDTHFLRHHHYTIDSYIIENWVIQKCLS